MKFVKFAALSTLVFAIASPAARSATAEPAAVKISDTEAVIILKTIEGFAQGNQQKTEIYDRKKGKTVALRLDRVVTDDPDCVVFPAEGIVAICGECTEVIDIGKSSESKNMQEGDKYVLWFVINRGTLVTATVKDIHIKSVNGKPMYTWATNAEGKWEPTLVPDGAAAPVAPAPAPAP
jgi:hypothetical protein